VGQRVWAYAIAIGAAAITSAAAADLPVEPPLRSLFSPKPIAQWESEVGGRYWFSSGRTQVNLFGVSGDPRLVSRLTYSNLQAQSGEVFGRLEHRSGFFVKGFAGGGAITGGSLRDEDFPPFTFPFPYSSTNSEQRNGRLTYATVDLGWRWRSQSGGFGFFAGYSFSRESANAFGCTQTASNPGCGSVISPPLPTSVLGITQETNWNAIRLGINGELRFGGWIFDADLAWIPYAHLNASDTHWLRIPIDFSGPTPELGAAFSNVQMEALIRYQFLNGISVGLGGRYWRISTAAAEAHFESSTPGFGPQTLSLVSERWGGFLQASYQFGALPLLRY
jgi:hypothetical protein